MLTQYSSNSRLCAGALAQILRKSGAELPECIKVLLDSSSGGQVQLAGMILIQVNVLVELSKKSQKTSISS